MQIVAVACAGFWGLGEKSVAVRLMSNLKDSVLVQMGTWSSCVFVTDEIGNDGKIWQGRAGCIAFVGGFLTFMSIGSFPSFVEDMKVTRA